MSSAIGSSLNLSAAIRAISVAGTSGYVVIGNTLDIQTNGRYSPGIYISGGNSQVHVNHSVITTAGQLSNALKLGKVRDAGTGSAGFYSTGAMKFDTTAAAGTPAILMLGDRTLLNANGATSSGEIVSAAEVINFGNSDLTARTLSDGATASFNNTVFRTVSATASLFRVDAGQTNASLNLRGGATLAAAAPGGWLMEIQDASAWANNPASVTLNVTEQARIAGLTTRGVLNSDLFINLDKQAIWTLAPRGSTAEAKFTQLQISGGATVEAGGDPLGAPAAFFLTGDVLNNSGALNMANGRPGDRLTVQGGYQGGGVASVVQLDTVLGGDASMTDSLHIAGATTGASSLRVTNTGGAGAQTVEGIRVVEVDGASNGVFTLLGDYSLSGQPAVIGGAYAYTLHKNGISTPGDGDWYLRSTLSVPTGGGEGQAWNYVHVPAFQPGSPLYETLPRVGLGFMQMLTLQQRVGNRYWPGQAGVAPGGEGSGAIMESSGVWGRLDGSFSRSASGRSTTDAHASQRMWRGEVGADFLGWSGTAGVLTGGVMAHYGQVLADVTSPWGRGSNRTSGYGVGATATWYGTNGFYADAQGRLSWLDTDLSSETLGRRMGKGIQGLGHALSLELGQRFSLSNSFLLIPQAQLSWTGVRYDRFVDPYGAVVSAGDGQSLQGRLGLALQREQQWMDASGRIRRASIYGIANLYHEFLDGVSVKVSGTRLANREARTWAGVGVGGSYNLNGDALSLYGEIQAAANISGRGDSYRLSGKAGLRIKW